MSKKTVSAIMMSLLVLGTLALASNIQQVKASGTVHIRADGSIDPPTAPICTADNITYTLTGNITADTDGIVIERDNILVDGVGYTLQANGSGSGTGINLDSVNNVTLKNTNIENFGCGAYPQYSSNNTISGNNITNSAFGIEIQDSDSTVISGNNITNNAMGIWLSGGSFSTISTNNVASNKYWGIFLGFSAHDNTVFGNNIIANHDQGVSLYASTDNYILGNNIIDSNFGIFLQESSDNEFYHNNFVNNTEQVHLADGSANFWDDGYPSGGNHWSNYTGADNKSGPNQDQPGSDGIGDNPYVIDVNNIDHYPLMNPYNASSLYITISPRSATLDVGQPQLFTSIVTGGTSPYMYQWYLNGAAVPGATFSSWTFTPTSTGSYTIYANVTDSVGVQATSKNATVTVNIGTHDVTVTNVASSKTVVGQGFSASINVTVANRGDYTETFNVTTSVTSPPPHTIGVVIDIITVSLDAGNNITISLAWNTTGLAIGNYTFTATGGPVPGETNTTDNTFSLVVKVTIPGDINGDFQVSLSDLVLLANAYGSKPVDIKWNPNADINSDGKVSLSDLVLMANHYGQHYP